MRRKNKPVLIKKNNRTNNVEKSKFKDFMNKFWTIVWRDDSLKGWFISLIFLFILIKGIFFPVLSLATGTQLPLVIVESCSMYHDGNLLSNFDDWFSRHDLKYFEYKVNKKEFENFNFKKGFNKGDILFITAAKAEKLKVGDIIIFNADYRHPIIHRLISIKKNGDDYTFSTLGDNNNGQLEFEKTIKKDQLVGKATFNIAPYLGWAKLIFFEKLRYPSERGLCNEN